MNKVKSSLHVERELQVEGKWVDGAFEDVEAYFDNAPFPLTPEEYAAAYESLMEVDDE